MANVSPPTPTNSLLLRAVQIGADPADSDELRLQKSLLAICALAFVLAGFGWGLMYFSLGQFLPGTIPFSYGLFSILSIIHFAISRNYVAFRFSQLTLILILPFLLMLSLGGFVQGGAVIIWSLISPMGAILFDRPKNAPKWFAAFLVLVFVSAVAEPHLPTGTGLDDCVITNFFVLNLSAVSGLVFLMVSYFVLQKNVFQERSENLLLNILPEEIVKLLKQRPGSIAESFDSASVLFADIVEFTPMSRTMSPVGLVDLLNEVFSHFDRLVDKYRLEKIKTIGDCYMVAAGIPSPRADHAHVLVRMALEIHEHMRSHEFNGHRLAFRIGVNSGPVVAGVIGSKKFSYDLWGDAVNTASRLESHGRKDTIHITSGTYELIADDFVCESRGTITVKGMGQIETWFVTGERTGDPG